LNGRRTFVEQYLGKCDPGAIAEFLIGMKPSDYENREDSVGALRLLPFESRFETQVDYWASTSFKGVPQEDWGKLIEGLNLSGNVAA